jgi:hypothetical protein
MCSKNAHAGAIRYGYSVRWLDASPWNVRPCPKPMFSAIRP